MDDLQFQRYETLYCAVEVSDDFVGVTAVVSANDCSFRNSNSFRNSRPGGISGRNDCRNRVVASWTPKKGPAEERPKPWPTALATASVVRNFGEFPHSSPTPTYVVRSRPSPGQFGVSDSGQRDKSVFPPLLSAAAHAAFGRALPWGGRSGLRAKFPFPPFFFAAFFCLSGQRAAENSGHFGHSGISVVLYLKFPRSENVV